MPTNLVFAAGRNAHVKQRPTRIDLHKRKLADRALAVEWLVYQKRIRLPGKVSGDPCLVALLNLAACEYLRQRGRRSLGMGNQDQSVGRPVEPMYDKRGTFWLQVLFSPPGDGTVITPF
jgi:hypothetical protein